jgi:glutaredoxin
MNTEIRNRLVALLREAGRAHHDAFDVTGGDDPDWPIWYADYLQEPLAERFDMSFNKSRLIYCLMDADFDHQARSPASDWAEHYADRFMERCAPSETAAGDKLTLYHFDSCPFCRMVRSAIDELGLQVELRDIFENAQYRDELVEARGRPTVPVLRITSPGGEERWMPESRDIVEYLEKIAT